MKGAQKFGRTRKLALRYVGLFPIIEDREIAYMIKLPSSLAGVHGVLHISHLRKCVRDPETTITLTALEDLVVESDMTLVRHLVCIMTKNEKKLRNKTVILMKVQWSDDERLYMRNREQDYRYLS